MRIVRNLRSHVEMASKSSDRRLAAGAKAARLLSSVQRTTQGNEGTTKGEKKAGFGGVNGGNDRNKTNYLVSASEKIHGVGSGQASRPYGTYSSSRSSNSLKVSKAGVVKPAAENSKVTKHKQKASGKKWEDETLQEWDPKHFRLFVGNLGTDANDQLLVEAFDRYPSFVKARVPMDKKTGKNKGYGFVAFSSADCYLRAFKEMNGKYVGQHPVQLKRAQTSVKK